MRLATRGLVVAGLTGAALLTMLVWLGMKAKGRDALIEDTLRQRKMYLADLRNDGYLIAFPAEKPSKTHYSGRRAEYVHSAVAPDGRTLFAFKRTFGEDGFIDTLVRRELANGSEETLPTPFVNFFQYAVSPGGEYIVTAGRRKASERPRDWTDGIFLFSLHSGRLEWIAPYNGASFNRDIRSLNVADGGNVVIYEEAGTVLRWTRINGRLVEADRHPGEFPVLLPNGDAYLYIHNGRLLRRAENEQRDLFVMPQVVGALRVSPDGLFVAFGTQIRSGEGTQLRVCEINSGACADGPTYSQWIAGRETFWIRR